MPDYVAKANEQAKAYARRYTTMKTGTIIVSLTTGLSGALTALIQAEGVAAFILPPPLSVVVVSAVLGALVTAASVVDATLFKPERLATVTTARNLLRAAAVRLASVRTTEEDKESIAIAIAEKKWDDLEELIHSA